MTGARNPIVDLTCTHRPVADAEAVQGLASPLRAALEAGARFLVWNPAGVGDPGADLLQLQRFDHAEARTELGLRVAGPDRLTFVDGPVTAFGIEEVVVAGGDSASLMVAPVFADGHAGAPLRHGLGADGHATWTPDAGFLLEALARGGLGGFVVTAADLVPLEGRVHAWSRAATLPAPALDARLAHPAGDLLDRLAPPVPGPDCPVRCMLAGPSFVLVAEAGPGAHAFAWTDAARASWRWSTRLEPLSTWIAWFEARDRNGRIMRSRPITLQVVR
ncbi:MAG: hypothetical protein R3F30_03340 [Planctomycetota bacterium]